MTSEKKEQNRPNGTSVAGSLLRIIISIAILVCGVFLAKHLLETSPKAKPKSRPVRQVIVETIPIIHSSNTVTLTALGNIVPSMEIQLKPQVSGEITSMSDVLQPGELVKEGQQLLTIDPTDYQLAIMQFESEVAKASASLNLEMGNQKIAQKEFELLGEEASAQEKKLILRKPQLLSAQASLKTAQAKLLKAKLDLERTKIKAPFNGVVRNRSVNLGAKVNSSSILGEVVGTDTFWAELLLPVEKLPFIHLPHSDTKDGGSTVKIYSSAQKSITNYKTGKIVRLAPDLEENGRLAKVYVEIDDPLNLKAENSDRQRLFLGSYVHAEIMGISLDDIIMLERKHLRDNNSIWLMNKGQLKIKPVEIVYKEKDNIFIKNNIPEGSRLITTNLNIAVEGMLLKSKGAPENKKKPGAGNRDGRKK